MKITGPQLANFQKSPNITKVMQKEDSKSNYIIQNISNKFDNTSFSYYIYLMHETIRKLREQNNYSQSAMAEILKISRQMYVKYENGDVDPPVKIIVQMCKLYNVSYDFIIEDKLCNSKTEQSAQKKYVYSSHTTGFQDLEVASPTPAYGNAVGYKNKSAKTKSFETVVETLRGIPSEQFPAILAFVDFLKLQNLGAAVTDKNPTSSENVIKGDKSESKSMDAFFDLAGKIDLSEDELKSFRENSLI